MERYLARPRRASAVHSNGLRTTIWLLRYTVPLPSILQTLTGLKKSTLSPRDRAFEPLTKDTNFTYVPPPKEDITDELLAQSLAVQPQDQATIAWVIPHFQDGSISFGAQMNSFYAAIFMLNASVDLPCTGIGGNAQPDLEVRPKYVENATAQVIIPDCTIIAVNMYNPNVINYWVQNKDGSIHTLASSNKIVDIGRLNTTASVSLVVRTRLSGAQKRSVREHKRRTAERRFLEDEPTRKRGLSQPDYHTATMTAEACAAMRCHQNGGSPAMFNVFTNTCWCKDPVYVEIDYSSLD